MTRCFITSKIYNLFHYSYGILNPENSWVFHYFRPRIGWNGGACGVSPNGHEKNEKMKNESGSRGHREA